MQKKIFCEKYNLPDSGVLLMNIHENIGKRTGNYATLIIDFDKQKLLEVWPRTLRKASKEIRVIKENGNGYYCNFHAGLPSISCETYINEMTIKKNVPFPC